MESDKAYYKTSSNLLLKEAGGSAHSSWGNLDEKKNRGNKSQGSLGGENEGDY